jgi:hypothetical protein
MDLHKDAFEEDNEISRMDEEEGLGAEEIIEAEEEEIIVTEEEPEAAPPAKPAKKKKKKAAKKKKAGRQRGQPRKGANGSRKRRRDGRRPGRVERGARSAKSFRGDLCDLRARIQSGPVLFSEGEEGSAWSYRKGRREIPKGERSKKR